MGVEGLSYVDVDVTGVWKVMLVEFEAQRRMESGLGGAYGDVEKVEYYNCWWAEKSSK